MKPPEEVTVAPTLAAQYATASGMDPKEISAAMGKAFTALQDFAGQHKLRSSAPPRAIYTGYDESGTEFIVAMPITAVPEGVMGSGEVTIGEIPAGKTLRFVHRGPYPKLMETYQHITQWMKAEGMIETEADWAKYMPMWEEYVNNPESTPENDLITNIYVPLG
ncbi:MAG: GyrI-like domain-containing protein [Gemmatimonadota bacterium]|nr:MAG: GyrI-like domain-containing protein [Gemmatimonadota bacterium]